MSHSKEIGWYSIIKKSTLWVDYEDWKTGLGTGQNWNSGDLRKNCRIGVVTATVRHV
jgi:hypothetical protein